MKKLKQKKVPVRQIDGTYKRKSIYGYTGKEIDKKAKAAQEKAEAAYQNSLHPTFESVANEWWAQHEAEVAEYTQECYRAPLRDVINEFGANTLEEIKPLNIQRFLNRMAEQKFAKQTIRLRRIVLNMVFDFAVLHDMIDINPTVSVRLPKSAGKTTRLPPTDEEIQIALASEKAPFGLYPIFLYYTGLRRSEALAITWEDIDFKNEFIIINKKVIFVNNRPVLESGSKSEAGIRTVPLLQPLKAVLQRQRKSSGLLFPNKAGEHMSKSQFDNAYNDYRNATGITATSHQFRHAFATLCYDAGLEDKDIADTVGHASAETTKKIYVHIREQRRKSFTDKLNSVV